MCKWLRMVEKIEKTQAWKRREEILQIIESLGTTHVSKTELAKKYGVSLEQIRKDFIVLGDKVAKVDTKELSFQVNLIFEFAINELLKIARNEKLRPLEKAKIIQVLTAAVDRKTDNLIKLGLIQPVTENVNVRHSVNSELCETVVQVARELREQKGDKGNPPQQA